MFFLPLLNVAGSYAVNRGGWGRSCPLLVLAFLLCAVCCGKSCHRFSAGGYRGAGVCVFSLSCVFLVLSVLGEDVGLSKSQDFDLYYLDISQITELQTE